MKKIGFVVIMSIGLLSACFNPSDQHQFSPQTQMIPNVPTQQDVYTRVTEESTYDVATLDTIAEKVKTFENVEDVRIVLYDDFVLTGVVFKEEQTDKELVHRIHNEIADEVDDVDIYVFADNDSYDKLKKADHILRTGGTTKEHPPRGTQLFQEFNEYREQYKKQNGQ
ncbi:YhcN/YlaJ family sporulation lipoprotein [Alkalihalobacterium bogoriense]|uniref:YhcN/YlaJ family sporulation lipoprotein n=1 Tax=Alkalihalobacterium bogoriense TaxID=246272 RepID=UPI00047AA061|nr:YhcN/YlaJ family sporulation lipoprotein [Alkalihalobacterium bogoriense]